MRLRSTWGGAALMALTLAAPGTGAADAPVSRGEEVYAARCKECHESGDDRAPQRDALARKTPAEIIAAMTGGPMTPMAEGLTPEDKQAVADYLTGH
ncbi:cytochrome c [Phenylobacterium sp.]|uniref:c-type cytochrome n=1 Tax=Phenylobacterium sp. TaxID=1871053 RepID=UPI0026009CA7|nr:cytochrome c [Phenylobacterium sp.]MBX3482048.1 cytochrome c [Phenylobacterium sp.]